LPSVSVLSVKGHDQVSLKFITKNSPLHVLVPIHIHVCSAVFSFVQINTWTCYKQYLIQGLN